MALFNHHPKALPYLFLTEMWERFGFYVVQGMLVLYMTKSFGFSDDTSFTIMGVFSALAYIAPFIGGSIADRLLGFKASIIWGGLFLSSGYAMLALPWANGFYLSLATIIVGNGLFKPNISSLLGSLYEHDDPRRESGFTLFYIGINLGALLAGVSSGYIKDHISWHASFALASMGLIIGLIIFGMGVKRIMELKHNPFTDAPNTRILTKIGIILGCVIAIFLISSLLQNALLAKWLLPCAGIALMTYLLIVATRQTPANRKRLFSLIALILSSIIFWMLWLQIFFAANLFIERMIDRTWGGMTIPTTVFYALQSVFIIILGPAFAWSWQNLSRSDKNPSPFLKFVVAIAFVGLAFLVLGISTYFPAENHLVNPLWIVLSYFLITIGELLLSPIGLSAVTTLAPRHLVGMMMGIWFVATGFGGQFAGWLAKIASIPENTTNIALQLSIYRHAFLDYFYIAVCVAIGLFFIHLFLKKILETNER